MSYKFNRVKESYMPSLSVCMMVQNSEKTLTVALESLANVYDKLIIVDGGSNDSTCDIALTYGATIIHSPWLGNHSQQRNVYLKYVNTDWVFVLDSDEFINSQVVEFLQLIKLPTTQINTDNFWITRKWISPFSKNHYITSKPHSPDFQRRLFKYNEQIFYQGQIHENLHNLIDQGQCLAELSIYHLDLFINSEEKRRDKIRKYSQLDPRNGGRHYYLPDHQELKIELWNQEDITYSVKVFLESIKNNSLANSELNSLIPAEIKNDEFYYAIQKISQEEEIKTALEIGSSSGEGSTEAFVTGLRENPNKPILFCMEVSTTRFTELKNKYENNSFVKCYNISSVSIKKFPDEREVIEFYNNTQTNLNFYPSEQVIAWLRQDVEYLNNSGVSDEGIQKIKQENKIAFFDLVLIDGSEFTGSAELDEVYGAKYICLDDIHTFKNYQNFNRLLSDPDYILIISNRNIRNGYAIFQLKTVQIASNHNIAKLGLVNYEYSSTLVCSQKNLPLITSTSKIELPIHFFTIVLNGQPFIRYHIEIFKQLPFKWHWHIVEGVAELKHDTEWSLKLGGYINDEIHDNGRSNDSTTEYLDELAQQYPDNITVYRKPDGMFWDGKREMVNEPLLNINEECLLWQIDADELWTVEHILTARQMFIDNPDKTAAFYWCWYFVGERIIISTRNCYAQNPRQEWLRTWRYKPGAVWVAHEPPRLEEPLPNGQWRDVAAVNPFLHQQTEKYGLVFQHFAYVTPEQLRFKEQYYGYSNAVSQWKVLQETTKFPVLLREYFSWLRDETMVDTVESCGIVPIAQKELSTNSWRFLQSDEVQEQVAQIKKPTPIILVDGVFFQLYQTGIARVWKSLLEEWVNSGFTRHIVVLDRAETAPKIPGIRYRSIPRYDYNNTDADREMLQELCDEENTDLFISSYYTTPTTTPSVFMAYDMIPEVMGCDTSDPMWREKHHGIQHASSYIAISEHTAHDLARCFTDIPLESITVAHCGVSSIFSPGKSEEVNAFKLKYGITKPYFILVGAGSTYKNSILLFQALSKLANNYGFDIVCTGSGGLLKPEFRAYTSGSIVYMLQLSDEELATAYSGAIALVYPSKYEGFGMPVIEAMACGCPVITCPNASIPEVAGDAAIYVNDDDVDELANALCEVQKPSTRHCLITAGLAQAEKFSWTKMAQTVSYTLIEATLLPLNLNEINLIIFPDWLQPEELIGLELQRVMKMVATHFISEKTTLLIDTANIAIEDAELFLSSVAMNLLVEEDLDVTEGLEISLVANLADIQWEALLSRIQARIILEYEDQNALIRARAETLTSYQIEEVSQAQSEQFFFA
jgi:glycosyltransferase involved in cell wall biosynthesis